MSFTDQDGNKINTLLEAGFSQIDQFMIGCYYFSFGPMKEVDLTSIMFKMQQYHNQRVFKAEEFVSFLRVRKIPFKLRWIPCRTWTLKSNLQHFLFITKLNSQTRK